MSLCEHAAVQKTVSEAAAELGVTAAWLRFGERLGSLPPAKRTDGGHRRYTSEDVQHLRELGVGQRKRRVAGRDE